MKTLVAIFLLLTPQTASAGAGDSIYGEPLPFFAACAGRLSAQMEFQWLMSDPAAEETAQQRAAIIDILEVLTPPGQGRDVLNHRISAKAAHSALLTTARFRSNAARAIRAEAIAANLIGDCTRLLLS